MMIAMSEDDNDDDGDGATGNKVDDDGDCATGDGATGYNDNNNDGSRTMGDEVNDYGKGTTGRLKDLCKCETFENPLPKRLSKVHNPTGAYSGIK